MIRNGVVAHTDAPAVGLKKSRSLELQCKSRHRQTDDVLKRNRETLFGASSKHRGGLCIPTAQTKTNRQHSPPSVTGATAGGSATSWVAVR